MASFIMLTGYLCAAVSFVTYLQIDAMTHYVFMVFEHEGK